MSKRKRKSKDTAIALAALALLWWLSRRSKAPESGAGIEVTKTSPLRPGENPTARGSS